MVLAQAGDFDSQTLAHGAVDEGLVSGDNFTVAVGKGLDKVRVVVVELELDVFSGGQKEVIDTSGNSGYLVPGKVFVTIYLQGLFPRRT